MTIAKTFRGLNAFDIDRNLQNIMQRAQPAQFARWRDDLSEFGAWVGDELDSEATYTDRHGRPLLAAYDRNGDIVNEVRLNPAWTKASQEIYRRGIVGLNHLDQPASFLITFAMGYMTSQSDVSLHCPATMTGAVAHILRQFTSDRAIWRTVRPECF